MTEAHTHPNGTAYSLRLLIFRDLPPTLANPPPVTPPDISFTLVCLSFLFSIAAPSRSQYIQMCPAHLNMPTLGDDCSEPPEPEARQTPPACGPC